MMITKQHKRALIAAFDRGRVSREQILPSKWYEQHMVFPPGNPFPGPMDYNLTPWWREPVDNMAPWNPVREQSLMMVNQIGKTDAFINAVLTYLISEHPGPIQYLTGHQEGNAEAVRRLDEALDNCGLRDRGLIRATSKRARKTKSGDTDVRKDFLGGHLIMGVLTNVKKDARQHTIRVQIRDDMDGAPIITKSGDTATAFNTRVDAFQDRAKVVNISSPEISGLSNIEKAWNRSDKRYYNVPCPSSRCGKLITLEWEWDVGKEKAGLHWRVDSAGRVIESSIEYICPKCGNGFKEREKYEMNLAGIWVPTVENPIEPLHRGYTLNALYPVRLRTWLSSIQHYMKAYPANAPKDETVEQTLYNTVWAKPYQKSSDDMQVSDLQIHNKRPYAPGVVPEDMSIRDGNGKIMMLAAAFDLNGVFEHPQRADDVRIDYEVIAFAESGATYSIDHGSVGTFIYRETDEQKAIARDKWTYDFTKPLCVWPKVDEILMREYPISGSNRRARVLISGMDTGNWERTAFQYIDQKKFFMVGLKGTSENKNKPYDRETPKFKISAARPNLYIVDGHTLKDNIAGMIRMKWRSGTGESQPRDFMNYPIDPTGQKYNYENYFSHYEAEHKAEDKDKNGNPKGYVWKKKSSNLQNHMLDCRVYNLALKEIFLHLYLVELKKRDPAKWRDIKQLTWPDFVTLSKVK